MYKISIKDEFKEYFTKGENGTYPKINNDELKIEKKTIKIFNETPPIINPFNDAHIGEVHNRLIIIGYAGKDKKSKKFYICRCSCADKTEKIIDLYALRDGKTKSCGCYQKEELKRKLTKHNKSFVPEYQIWATMIQRTTNVNATGAKNYKERGIIICDKWKNSFEAFYEDMGPRPEPKNGMKYSIERIDVNGNYEPNNCKWELADVQARNKRVNKFNRLGHNGIRFKENRYRVRIYKDNKEITVGSFKTLSRAIMERIFAEAEYWGPDQIFTKVPIRINYESYKKLV